MRCNLVVALGDLAFRFPNLVEPWTAHLYQPLSDPAPGAAHMHSRAPTAPHSTSVNRSWDGAYVWGLAPTGRMCACLVCFGNLGALGTIRGCASAMRRAIGRASLLAH